MALPPWLDGIVAPDRDVDAERVAGHLAGAIEILARLDYARAGASWERADAATHEQVRRVARQRYQDALATIIQSAYLDGYAQGFAVRRSPDP